MCIYDTDHVRKSMLEPTNELMQSLHRQQTGNWKTTWDIWYEEQRGQTSGLTAFARRIYQDNKE